MMGHSHALSGATVWLAVTATGALPALGLPAPDPMTVLGGTFVTAGAALLPDIDHPNATVSRSGGVVGELAAGLIGALSGGHRKGTHSLAAVGLVALGSWLLNQLMVTVPIVDHPIALGGGILLGVATALACKVLRIVRRWSQAGAGGVLLAGLATVFIPGQLTWLPWAIGAGYALHLVGDLLTHGGVPLLWPFKIHRRAVYLGQGSALRPGGAIAVPVLGRTGSWKEGVLAGAMGIYTACMLANYSIPLLPVL